MKLIATLNSVYDDGSFAEITAIAIVKDEHEGELWFCESKPDDGTQVDYVLHKVSEVFAASNLVAAIEELIFAAEVYDASEEPTTEDINRLHYSIAKARVAIG